jgi:tetratricopeptide (TPR) repeat protein
MSGSELFASGEHAKALKSLEAEREANGNAYVCLCNMACAQLAMEMYRGCTKTCDEAISLAGAGGGNLRAHIVKGMAFKKMGYVKKAKAAWEAGLKDTHACSDVLLFCELQQHLNGELPSKPVEATVAAAPARIKEPPPKEVPPSSKKVAAKPNRNLAVVKQLLVKAEAWSAKKINRTACASWKQVIDLNPTNEIAFVCELRIGKLWLSNEKWDQACTHLTAATDLGTPSQKAVGLFLLARAQLGQESFAAAKASLDEALLQLSSEGASKTLDLDAAIAEFCTEEPKTVHDILALQARVHRLSGQLGLAAALSQQVVREDENHREALIELALLSQDSGQHEQAVQIFLRLLITNSAHAEIKDEFSASISRPGGFDVLMGQLQFGEQVVPALALLANVTKDCGALSVCIKLQAKLVEYRPDVSNFALNLIHLYENMADPRHAFEAIIVFLRRNPSAATNSGLTCGQVLKVVESIVLPRSPALISEGEDEASGGSGGSGGGSGYPKEAAYRMEMGLLGADGEDGATTQASSASSSASSSGALAGAAAAVAALEPVSLSEAVGAAARQQKEEDEAEPEHDAQILRVFSVATGERVDMTEGSGEAEGASGQTAHDEQDYDLLAVFFTLVKVLFTAGCLTPIPSLVRLIEPARRGRKLGTSSVRNEHVYYVLISQLLSLAETPVECPIHWDPNAALLGSDGNPIPVLYMCGDRCVALTPHAVLTILSARDCFFLLTIYLPTLCLYPHSHTHHLSHHLSAHPLSAAQPHSPSISPSICPPFVSIRTATLCHHHGASSPSTTSRTSSSAHLLPASNTGTSGRTVPSIPRLTSTI